MCKCMFSSGPNRRDPVVVYVVLEGQREDFEILQSTGHNLNEGHVLRDLYPEKVQKHYNFRPGPHDFKLPVKDDENCIQAYKEYYINTNSTSN